MSKYKRTKISSVKHYLNNDIKLDNVLYAFCSEEL